MCEAESFVKRDCTSVAGAYGQLDTSVLLAPFFERGTQESGSDAFAAELRQDADAQDADMGMNRPLFRQNVRPADELPVGECDELHIVLGNIVDDEVARLLERRRFEKGEILAFARDQIERAVERLDMFLRDRDNSNL